MKKELLVVFVTILFFAVVFSGCIEDETEPNGENGQTQSESFEGRLYSLGGPPFFYPDENETIPLQSYPLVDTQGQRYSNVEDLGNGFEIGDTVIIVGTLNDSSIVLENISFKYPECENDEPDFIGTWRHQEGSSPWFNSETYSSPIDLWFNENATFTFYENKTAIVETFFGKGASPEMLTWNIVECNLVFNPYWSEFDYEIFDNGNSFILSIDTRSGVFQKIQEVNSDASKFYGTWDGTYTSPMSGTIDISYTFFENGSYYSTYEYGYFWEVKNNKLYAPVSAELGLDYEFSNGDTHLTISMSGVPYIELDKIE